MDCLKSLRHRLCRRRPPNKPLDKTMAKISDILASGGPTTQTAISRLYRLVGQHIHETNQRSNSGQLYVNPTAGHRVLITDTIERDYIISSLLSGRHRVDEVVTYRVDTGWLITGVVVIDRRTSRLWPKGGSVSVVSGGVGAQEVVIRFVSDDYQGIGYDVLIIGDHL